MATTVPFAASTIGSYWAECGKRLKAALVPFGYELALNSQTGDTLNVLSVGRGESVVGVTAESFLDWGQRRFGPYAGEKLADLRVIAALNNTQWLAAAIDRASGITSLREIADRTYPWKVVLPLPDHKTSVYTDRLMELHGITRDNIREWGGEITYPQDTRPRTEAPGQPWVMRSMIRENIAAGKVAGYFNYLRWTNMWARDITSLLDLRFIRFEPAALRTVAAEFGALELVIPAGMYRGIDEDIPSIGWRYDYVYGTSETPAELVRAILTVLDAESFIENAVGYSYCGCKLATLPASLRYHDAVEPFVRERAAGVAGGR